MRLLLDTHALVWFANDAPELSSRAKTMIENTGNEVFVSAISAFEIATKHRLGKLPGAERLAVAFEVEIRSRQLKVLSVTDTHGRVAGLFAAAHRDPFDRLLAAQAIIDELVLLSVDHALDAFGVVRLW